MNNKLVSIIVPTYNGEKFIAQTLEAIIDQDYDNLEIIDVQERLGTPEFHVPYTYIIGNIAEFAHYS